MHLTNHKSQTQSSSVQTIFIPVFSQKRLKPTKNCLEPVNIFLNVSMVKMSYNPMYLTNHKIQRLSSSVQTTFILIFSQKRLKPTKNLLVVNSFVSFSMFKLCYNPMHLPNHKSKRQGSSVKTTFIPMFSQKRIKPTKNFLEVLNSFVSFSMVKMCNNLMHLTNYKSQGWSKSVQTILIPILSQKSYNQQKIAQKQ